MMGKHGEQEFQNFLETLNCYHPTIKFRAENSRAKINFLAVTVMTCYYFFVKPTDTHQYLHASLYHVSCCEKLIPFSQVLCLSRKALYLTL